MRAPASPQLPTVRHELVNLTGGLDLLTPTLSLAPGVLREALNFEVSITGGYTRIRGYERYDGRPRPSDAAVGNLVLSMTTGLAIGNTVNGQTSGATGVVIAISGNAVAYTKATGTFQTGENLRVATTVIGTITQLFSNSTDPKMIAQNIAAAADLYRADIGAVPGSGPVRGVSYYNNVCYAWRDNVGATALQMWKATAGGWVQIALGWELKFTAGQAAGILDTDSVLGGTSAATGQVVRVVVESGAFATNNAAGRLILSATTGTFQAAEQIKVGGTLRATCSGAATAITLLPGGRVTTDFGSFTGAVGLTAKMYGADGKNRGFEYNGTAYVPINTGMVIDTPSFARVHAHQLFLFFGSSMQSSGPGTPYLWTPVYGASELALDDTITDAIQMVGNQSTSAMVVYLRQRTHILYGTGSNNWNLTMLQRDTGAYPYSAQEIGSCYALEDKGVVELQATQAYGNFTAATLTASINTWLQPRRSLLVGSSLNHEKNQYRIFFSDGYGLYVTIVNGQLMGRMPVYFPDPVTCICSGSSGTGAEHDFFGSANGYVYQLDAGTSFDGAPIYATALLNYCSSGDSRMKKRFRHAAIEIRGDTYAEIQAGYSLSYSSTARQDQPTAQSYAVPFSASYWDSFTWDSFVWDGTALTPTEIPLSGSAENIALRISSNGNYFGSFTLNSLVLQYSVRRGLR